MSANTTTTRILLPHVYDLGFQLGQFLKGSIVAQFQQQPSRFPISLTFITSFPMWYKEWWFHLLREDPVHVLVETTLLATILYFFLSRRSRRKGWKDQRDAVLTVAEEEELLKEWKEKTRWPIVMPATTKQDPSSSFPPVVVHSTNGRHLHIETSASRSTVLNFATFDFLGMQAPLLEDSTTPHPVRQAAYHALDTYGCGSCGPRGFYGTIDVHVKLEQQLAAYSQTEDAILYSDAAAAVTSTVAAFLKRGDVCVVDKAVYEPLLTGVQLSRATVHVYAHNDMDDLQRVMEQLAALDHAKKRPPHAQRRFVVTEGLFHGTGQVCAMKKMAVLLKQFCFRLILDESYSFGVLGATGRGVTEYAGVEPTEHMIRILSLEAALGSIGAVTVGTQAVVDHQRLCGAGYCFSASSPPFTACAALAALERVETTVPILQQNVQYMVPKLLQLLKTQLDDLLELASDEDSPIVVLKVAEIPETEYLNEVVFLQEVAQCMLDRGMAIVATHQGTLRLTITALHTTADMDKALVALGQAVDVVMNRFHDEDDVGVQTEE